MPRHTGRRSCGPCTAQAADGVLVGDRSERAWSVSSAGVPGSMGDRSISSSLTSHRRTCYRPLCLFRAMEAERVSITPETPPRALASPDTGCRRQRPHPGRASARPGTGRAGGGQQVVEPSGRRAVAGPRRAVPIPPITGPGRAQPGRELVQIKCSHDRQAPVESKRPSGMLDLTSRQSYRKGFPQASHLRKPSAVGLAGFEPTTP